ncbi:hypothetical protein A2773_03970 [Candidatus Gottesmanbacteria bacterium RIFCSPHIGHO2_01_FULL_39_10]|uniref:Uncharacterized protein n=1 Tax=Candidatus Gottesmanbacteria bacterium RIFCSPHIGHO2_01_FULL_39_10 TaxID=1798375 RepID=A0A1F5ZQY5_9BACT|nr:MAG: hypothetical protein A2773_03970 [Candidatus Gottesmanbacteria bacterium RIFCSPHIGHO2_01_FULL_39_10]
MKYYLYILLPLISLLTPTTIYSANTVTTGDSNVSTKTTNIVEGGKTQSKTVININGEEKTFESDGNTDVDWTSPDGKSKVIINNKTNSTSTTTSENVKGAATNPTSTYKMNYETKEKVAEDKADFFNLILEKIRSLLDSLSFF